MAAMLAVLTVLLGSPCMAGVPSFSRQVLHIPGVNEEDGYSHPEWTDLDGKGRRSAIGMLPDGRIYVFRQHEGGFSAEPDQVWKPPADTCWVTTVGMGNDAGTEILVSTGRGWFCYRQEAGAFVTEPKPLLEARQVYAEATVLRPYATTFGQNPTELPVLQDGRAVMYQLQPDAAPQPGKTTALKGKPELLDEIHWWIAPHHESGSNWGIGDMPAWSILAGVSFSERKQGEYEDKDPAQLFRDAMRKEHPDRHYSMTRGDVNGDGQKDALVWSTHRGIENETTFYLFLAGQDGQLSEKPVQALRCRGVPASWEPLADVNGDGNLELLTVELRDVSPTLGFAVAAFVSGKIDGRICIRTFDGKGFSRRPVFQLDVTLGLMGRSMLVQPLGDFNGDGRKDLLVWKSPTQADVYLSQATGDLFERTPSLRFDAPPFSWAEAMDLNGDKTSDIIFTANDSDEIVVYLSQPPREAVRK